jgi:hypothetical protein
MTAELTEARNFERQHKDEASATYQIDHLEDGLVVPRLGLFGECLHIHAQSAVKSNLIKRCKQEQSAELWL